MTTTAAAVEFVRSAEGQVAATLTPQHLAMNRNDLFTGGIRPHHYCLPVLKRETHRQALVGAATSGNPRFFLGTDSAPHARSLKEHAAACAGCYTAPHALALYATAFEAAGALGPGPDADVLDMFLLTTLTALRGASFAGSIPLVIDGVLDIFERQDAQDAMARLERLSDAVQVVVVTDREDIAQWADALGIEHAAVVEPGVVPT